MPVNNIPDQNLLNRSRLQRDILLFLAQQGATEPTGDRIGHLPRTGDIIAGIGRKRDGASYASISRALKRMCRDGVIAGYRPSVRTQGDGMHYCLLR